MYSTHNVEKISVSVSVKILKNIIRAKKFIFGILLHVVLKIINIWEVLLFEKY